MVTGFTSMWQSFRHTKNDDQRRGMTATILYVTFSFILLLKMYREGKHRVLFVSTGSAAADGLYSLLSPSVLLESLTVFPIEVCC